MRGLSSEITGKVDQFFSDGQRGDRQVKIVFKALLFLAMVSTSIQVVAQANLEDMRARAEAGDALAQFLIGYSYEQGITVVQNYQEAVKWYRLAAAQGRGEALEQLGLMYDLGRGVAQNYTRAYVWYSLAAAKGNANAASNRDEVRNQLSPQALEQAQAQATRCFESNFQDCD